MSDYFQQEPISEVWTRRAQRQEQEWWATNAACPQTSCSRREIALAVLGITTTLAGPVLILVANLCELQTDLPIALPGDAAGAVLLIAGACMTATANRSVSKREASALGETLRPYRFTATEPPL